ncbi:MAG: GNAT family N-acetyltransferase [Anaerolineae bacterium]|nr:GNAT family N-acetyltransferase [Anaerolineae bacterium]
MTYYLEVVSLRDSIEASADLFDLLNDAILGGASVGYLALLTPDEGRAYWLDVFHEVTAGLKQVLVVRDGAQRIVGSVQLAYSAKPNGRHRAEVQRLLVHREHRRRGLAQQLMLAVEERAREHGCTLLVLDTRKGDAAEQLYTKLGYETAGEIPGYARGPSGELQATVFMYKPLVAEP